uniref:Acid phosphatase n=1 Tax=Panagrolaimus sp. PS1159 TaxID=55785 RepID=A0AC35FJH7_9BILA
MASVIFFIVFLFNFCILTINGDKLVYVHALWRHGDRAPEKIPYPNDIYTEDYWPRGYAMLTNLGMNQLHELGTFFRNRYANTGFVNKTYNYKEVFVRSTDAPRALSSAQAFLNGMFPPENDELWQAGLNWQPIPVHSTTPGDPDPLLRPTDFDCPKYEDLWDDIKKSINKEIEKKYDPVLTLLATSTGIGNDLTVKKASKLVDITREVAHNLSQPEWITRRWPEYNNNSTLDIITEIYRIRRIALFDDKKLARLRGGYVLNDVLKRLLNASNGIFDEANKMLLYSTHDGTLLGLMYAMGVGDYQLIPYASALIFELHQDNNGLYYVQILYRKNGELQTIDIPDCGTKCEVRKLVSLFSSMTIPTEKKLYKECGTKHDDDDDDIRLSPKFQQLNPPQNAGFSMTINFALMFLTILYLCI